MWGVEACHCDSWVSLLTETFILPIWIVQHSTWVHIDTFTAIFRLSFKWKPFWEKCCRNIINESCDKQKSGRINTKHVLQKFPEWLCAPNGRVWWSNYKHYILWKEIVSKHKYQWLICKIKKMQQYCNPMILMQIWNITLLQFKAYLYFMFSSCETAIICLWFDPINLKFAHNFYSRKLLWKKHLSMLILRHWFYLEKMFIWSPLCETFSIYLLILITSYQIFCVCLIIFITSYQILFIYLMIFVTSYQIQNFSQ